MKMKNSTQPISLHNLAYSLSLANDMSTLVVTMRENATNKRVHTTAVAIPQQEYREWTEHRDWMYNEESYLIRREYIKGGFKDGKLEDGFCGIVADTIISQLAVKYPDLTLPNKQVIIDMLNLFN